MSQPGKIYLGQAVREMQSSPDWGAYTKVILKVDDENAYVSGTDGGLVLEADCPWATQDIADSVLASLSGYTYRPYDAQGAIVNPAVEIGDGVTANGIYSGIYTMSRKFSKLSAADISAPCNTEVGHEFQYTTTEDRRFVRMSKKISTEFAILADRMVAKVSGEHSSFGWEMLEDGMTWWANGTKVMEANSNGLKIVGTLESGSVITGSLMVGGNPISAENLYTGAYQSATNYGSWTTGSGYGIQFGYAIDSTSGNYPGYFKASKIYAPEYLYSTDFHCGGMTWFNNYANYSIGMITKTIDGTTIHYLGWTSDA